MNTINDKVISRLTVRLDNADTKAAIGSGVIYFNDHLKGSVYVLTAAHCLFADGDNFQDRLKSVTVQFYDVSGNVYHPVTVDIDYNLVYTQVDKDVAILRFSSSELENLIGNLPGIFCVRERRAFVSFAVKGFPNATGGEELDVIFPTWKQEMTIVDKFQLQLNEDYSSWATEGFSGSGVFLEANDEVYLYGIFTRFRPEDRGRVVYCQHLDLFNELLQANFLPEITFSYLGDCGMTPVFFKSKVEQAIENLGPRFNELLNFKLPIGLKFDDIAKNRNFKARIYTIFDQWLTEKSYRRLSNNSHLEESELLLATLRDRVIVWLEASSFAADAKFDTDWIFEEVSLLNEFILETMDRVYLLQREEEKGKKGIKKDHSYRPPYGQELERLREIRNNNDDFLGRLEQDVDIKLANNPCMILKGDAGCGKSHLLGDVATGKLKGNVPAILLLGQHFSSGKNIGANILEQLDLQCSFKSFLDALNDIGRQINSRVLILIDAINESKTADLWSDHIAGFIMEVSKYPFIGLVMTIRSTYYKSVLPEQVRDDKMISVVDHEGFQGNEYEALKLFCNYYGLRQPTFPILAPEFSNPLFLQFVCAGVSQSTDRSFPLGFHGIKDVFDLYIAALNKKFQLKSVYTNRQTLVLDAISKVASLCFKQNKRMLTLQEAVDLFDKDFEKFPDLLQDLIQENVLIKNMHYDYNQDKYYETIYFAYERFGDFYIAEELLNTTGDREHILLEFKEGGRLSALLEHHYSGGIFEAMAVLLPEKYDIEIYEALGWVFEKEEDLEYRLADSEMISRLYLKSLTWRSIKSLDPKKLQDWLMGDNFLASDDEWFLKMMELTAIPSHPLNSDTLTIMLKRHSMAKRDSFWQEHLLYYGGHDSNGRTYPVTRLVDWAWTQKISFEIDYETARLTAQSLAWLLASTDIGLRDRATKAMVNLLEQQPEALIAVLKKFRRTNDLYILERLYAVGYGCILRTMKKDSVALIAKYTYDTIFKAGKPPRHIKLRDYARNICEYGLYREVGNRFNMDLVRPPYKTDIPIFPARKDVDKYYIDYNDKTKKNRGRISYNAIHHSVISDDFGNKIIDAALHSFSPLRANGEKDLKEFVSSLENGKRKFYKGIVQSLELIQYYTNRRERAIEAFGSIDKLEEHLHSMRDMIELSMSFFSDAQREWLISNGIPYLELKFAVKDGSRYFFSSAPVKYWIVKRAFGHGYKNALHAQFDSQTSRYNDRHTNKVERIGKKYQWLAYNEILAILADNYPLADRWVSKKQKMYNGAWQLYLRDIDPAYITPDKPEEQRIDDLGIDSTDIIPWWQGPDYSYWNMADQQWAESLQDLPSAREFLVRKDEQGTEWLFLQHYIDRSAPKGLGQDKYFSPHKRMWFKIQGYIVRKKDKATIVAHLSDKNFYGNWMPENRDGFSRLINREKFWSPAYFDEGQDLKWDRVSNTNHQVIVATTAAKGSMESDRSGANTNYEIPCQTLFEALDLQYSHEDGNFVDTQGRLVVTNSNPDGILIRKDLLFECLKTKGLDIIWSIWGEKIADLGDHKYHMGIPGGIFTYNGTNLEGQMLMHERD